MIDRKCDKLVLKKKSGWGYKIYAREDSAKRAGARTCGGSLHLERQYVAHLHVIADVSVSMGEDFYGSYEVKCSKCGHVHEVIGSETVEELVECYVMGQDYGGGRA